MATVSSAEFWEDLYRRRGDAWELGRPAPALADWLEAKGNIAPPPAGRVPGGTHPRTPAPKVGVPGCGRGHDARLLARCGYDVWAFDFAADAVRDARALAEREGTAVRVEPRDIFALGGEYPNAFDGIWEYTCFCAIDPARRPEYVRTMNRILKPGGWFLACFYPVRRGGGGPPFPVAKAEVRRLLAPSFRIEREFVPTRSVPRRLGQEWMVLAYKTGAPS